jgi:hypothetical protein
VAQPQRSLAAKINPMDNPIWPLALVTIIFSIVGLIFNQFIKHRNIRLAEEIGRTPVHEEIAGGRFGLTNFTIPFVRLALYPTFMVISAWNRYLLEYSAIERPEVRYHLISKGLQIFHTKYRLPSIIIWSTNCDYLKTRIERQMSVHV